MAASRTTVTDNFRIPDELWQRLEPLLPYPRRSPKGGRPHLDYRQVLDGIFYVLRTGCQWKAVPPEFGSGSSLHRYFQHWLKRGVFGTLWRNALREYDELIGLDWQWQSLDGSQGKAPLGGEKDGQKPHRSRQNRHQAFATQRGGGPTDRRGGGRSQPAGYATGRGDSGQRSDPGSRGDRHATAASVCGQGV